MNEYVTMFQATGALTGGVIASLFYSWGGRSGKWRRRFVASFILASTVNIICALRGIWSPWLLAIYFPLMGGFSLGYGADMFHMKFIKRTIYASAVCMAGMICAIVLNAWAVFIPHVGIAAWSIYMGLKNPIEAAAEETFICMILNLGLLMYPFI